MGFLFNLKMKFLNFMVNHQAKKLARDLNKAWVHDIERYRTIYKNELEAEEIRLKSLDYSELREELNKAKDCLGSSELAYAKYALIMHIVYENDVFVH